MPIFTPKASPDATTKIAVSATFKRATPQQACSSDGALTRMGAGHYGCSPMQRRAMHATTAGLSEIARLGTARMDGTYSTGLPLNLHSGIQALSGQNLDYVKVHYNSPKPAQVNALAYAQGANIHLAPGQERQLPHEAWHVVQQQQRRVAATSQLAGFAINDNAELEREADVMGQRALHTPSNATHHDAATMQGDSGAESAQQVGTSSADAEVAQMKWIDRKTGYLEWDPPADGVVWYYDLSTHLMFYVVQGNNKKYLPHAGIENAKPRQEWARLYGSDPLAGEDNSVEPGLPPSSGVVELGAGEGRFSAAFKGKFAPGGDYLATDIAPEQGPTGFLSHARESRIEHRFGIDANQVDRRFLPRSVERLVAANPYGVGKDYPDASFGLMKHLPKGQGTMEPDPRFLSHARNILHPGGSIDIYGRTNTLRNQKRAKLGKQPTKAEEPDNRKRNAKALELAEGRKRIDQQYPETNENPYLNIKPEQLSALAKQTGYRVRVKRAKEPPHTRRGGNPDTMGKEAEPRKEGLQPFTTRFTFRPADDGYVSDEEHPRVDYDSDDASDWEDDVSVSHSASRRDLPQDNQLRADIDHGAHPADLPGRILGGMAAEIETDIDLRERNHSLSREQADALRHQFRQLVDQLIMDSIARIQTAMAQRDDAAISAVIKRGIGQMEDMQARFMQ